MGEDLRAHYDWDSEHEEPESTEIVCAHCEDEIEMTEECFLLQVVQCQSIGGQVHFYPVIDETDEDGDFLFEPYHFHFDCWEELYEKINTEMRDVPPVEDVVSVIECSCCGSGIRGIEVHDGGEIPGEYSATYSLGEFRRSERAPAPELTFGPAFVPIAKPEVLCTYCTAILNELAITMWEDFSHEGECTDCIQNRCWRFQACGCSCHQGENENE